MFIQQYENISDKNNQITQNNGIFISLEGVDGAGKTSHMEFIKDYLTNKGFIVKQTREPGGTIFGEELRRMILSYDISDITELLLLFASRQELITQFIMPNLAVGNVVITDRFIDSSIAYQAYARNQGIDKVESLIKILTPQIMPNLTLLFDVDLETAKQRKSKRQNGSDRIENLGDDFFNKVRNAYLDLAKKEPNRIKLIDNTLEDNYTQKAIVSYLDALYN